MSCVYLTICNELTSFILDLGSQDCSNYSSDKHAVKVKKAAERIARGDQSSLPLSSLPEESGSEESEPDVEEDQSPSPSHKSRKMAAGNKSGRDGSELPLPKKPGTLSNEALEEIRIFSNEVKVKADQLG